MLFSLRDDCIVSIVLVNHRGDMAHVDEVREFWRERGVTNFVDYEIINRGGALFVDTMQHEATREHGEAQELLAHFGGRPLCGAPFAYLFVGYDDRLLRDRSLVSAKNELPGAGTEVISRGDTTL